ncbi:uncharacterized protein BCR38DRAFT_404797 [Pseudomassariella vexata]|uniref:Uncharacterized protein n=1 Tax=Pseudomassariella vexata TaxID=1141098 RepID=A0A1Y2EJM4_9PEZI|nr:uncharacterized protein BCR38DRAFT_404797 [Pseudomassariella vexata]ORY71751.1 hypothetical protein BCR38DRAFT_404797 [Pseudomassariella vexata]
MTELWQRYQLNVLAATDDSYYGHYSHRSQRSQSCDPEGRSGEASGQDQPSSISVPDFTARAMAFHKFAVPESQGFSSQPISSLTPREAALDRDSLPVTHQTTNTRGTKRPDSPFPEDIECDAILEAQRAKRLDRSPLPPAVKLTTTQESNRSASPQDPTSSQSCSFFDESSASDASGHVAQRRSPSSFSADVNLGLSVCGLPFEDVINMTVTNLPAEMRELFSLDQIQNFIYSEILNRPQDIKTLIERTRARLNSQLIMQRRPLTLARPQAVRTSRSERRLPAGAHLERINTGESPVITPDASPVASPAAPPAPGPGPTKGKSTLGLATGELGKSFLRPALQSLIRKKSSSGPEQTRSLSDQTIITRSVESERPPPGLDKSNFSKKKLHTVHPLPEPTTTSSDIAGWAKFKDFLESFPLAFDLESEALRDEDGAYPTKLPRQMVILVDNDTRHVRGVFTTGVIKGFMLLEKAHTDFVFGAPEKFHWRGRDIETGMPMTGSGYLTISKSMSSNRAEAGAMKLSGVFRGKYGEVDFKSAQGSLPMEDWVQNPAYYRKGWELMLRRPVIGEWDSLP